MMKRLKKIISILMTILVISTGFAVSVSASSGYTDIPSSDSCYNAAIYLRDHNIMVGYTDTTFGKTGNLIRADVITILWRMLNKPEPYGVISSFPDCDSSAYYYKAVLWACSESVDIASGYENGNFGPTDLVSNQDLLTFIYRFACYCGYEDDNSTNRANYLTYFNRSSLTNKNTFGNYSKVPVGWAYHNGFITNNSIQGIASTTRGATAEYIYYFHQRFQRKYGLIINERTELEYTYSDSLVSSIQRVYNHHNISWVHHSNLPYNQFTSVMNTAFGNAKKMDLCYLYLTAHGFSNPGGDNHGMQLFTGANDAQRYLSPSELRYAIDAQNGIFVVMLETCYSGIFLSNTVDIGDVELSDVEIAQLNAEASVFIEDYVNELVGIESDEMTDISTSSIETRNLAGSKTIKVLGSARAYETSVHDDRAVTYIWERGVAFYNQTTGKYEYQADTNNDKRVSLNELFVFSDNEASQKNPHRVVCHPMQDNFIIFENRF